RHQGRHLLPGRHHPGPVPVAAVARDPPVEGMKKFLDWAGYAGIAVLAGLALLQLTRRETFAGPQGGRIWWALLIVGIVLVLASLLGYVKDPRAVAGRRSTRYGLNTAVMVLLLVG